MVRFLFKTLIFVFIHLSTFKYLVWSRKNGRLHNNQVEGCPDEEKNKKQKLNASQHAYSFVWIAQILLV